MDWEGFKLYLKEEPFLHTFKSNRMSATSMLEGKIIGYSKLIVQIFNF